MTEFVAKISEELAYGTIVINSEGEKEHHAGILHHKVKNADLSFNPVSDADGNIVISLQCAQYLEPNQYEVIVWNPPIQTD